MITNQHILSPYLFLFESIKNGYLAYNGLNNSFIKINKDLYELLNKAKSNISALEELDNESYEILKANFIICTEEIIQTQINHKTFLRNYGFYQHDSLNLTIAPTSSCNFMCYYCYESGIAPKTMNDITIKYLIDFIVEKCKKTQNKLKIFWYDGEPLLATDQIGKILEKLKEQNINIISQSIVTNGFFLNNENIAFLKTNNISFVQVTLDGVNPETHNERRKNKDGTGSWEKILSNMDNIIKNEHDIFVAVRCNVAKDNQEEFQLLKEFLEKRWANAENYTIYPGYLRNYSDNTPDCHCFTDIESSNFIIAQGVKNNKLDYFSYQVGGCSANQYNSYVIGPSGELYKCWNDFGRDEKVVGNIKDKKEKNNDLLLHYLSGHSMLDDEKCKNCCLFFVCAGGCHWIRVNNYLNNRNDSYCNVLKANTSLFLEEYYELKKKQNEENH